MGFNLFGKKKKPQPERRGIPTGQEAAGNAMVARPSSTGHGRPAGTPAPGGHAAGDPSLIPLADARVTVVGAGASGRAAARLLLREGARVTLTDDGKAERMDGTTCRFGDVAAAVRDADLIVLSPGVPRAHPALAAAAAAGTPVIGEVELAFRHLPAPLIGITGTNGKSTVTALTGHILSGWKRRVFTGGNLGQPLSEAALSDPGWELLVVELSSFQLESITTLAPRIAAVVNLSPDHMDRYANVSAYYAAKFRLFSRMEGGYAVLNGGDENTPVITDHHLPEGVTPVLFNRRDEGDGVRADGERITITTGGETHTVCALADLRLHGAHNVENAQAAAAICLLAGCPLPVVSERIVTFAGLPHRMESAGETGGVTWIDDSKATNPGAVVGALAGQAGPVVLLLGGRDKGGDLFSLREQVFLSTRDVVLFGEAAEKLRIVLQGHPSLHVADTLKDAVRTAAGLAGPGDTVLLSPACASFDEFDNFAARGDAFRRYVEALP